MDYSFFFDSSLTLYDTDGVTPLAVDQKSGYSFFDTVEGASISWQASVTGEYYVAVGSVDEDSTYQLVVSSSAPSVIEDVIVSSTQFGDSFIDVIGAENGLGYSLVGGHQLESLPWMNIDTFYLQFNEDVSSSLSADDVTLTGILGGTLNLDLVSYDTTSNTAEFRIDGNLNSDSFAISIASDSVFNPLGTAFDGEWAAGQTAPSGDSTQGGQFDFHFNVLVGDEDASGQVNTVDAINISEASTMLTDQTNFRRDIDGSGQINSADVFAAMSNNTYGLPADSTLPVSMASAVALHSNSDRDVFYSLEYSLAKLDENANRGDST